MLNLMMYLIPLREAFGINIQSIPLRLGEIFIPLIMIFLLLKKSNDKERKYNNKYVDILLIMLFLNLLLTVIIGMINLNTIDKSFFYKYIIRNVMYFVFILVLYKNIHKLKNIEFEKCVRFIIYIELLFYILEFFNIYMYFFDIIPYSEKGTNQLGSIIRYCGTASEPGYLAPILIIPLCYYNLKKDKNIKDKIHYLITWILIILTFSGFCYIAAVLIFIFNKRNINFKAKIKTSNILAFLFFIIFILVIITYFVNNKNSDLSEAFYVITNKINVFLFDNDNISTDYSANARKLYREYAVNMFGDYDFIEKILGRGTGAYSHSLEYEGKYGLIKGDLVQEASSIYHSTLTDRGIIGLFILVFQFYCVFKLKNNTIESTTIFSSILVQILQYYIVENVWIYYFWLEVALLIYYNYRCNTNNQQP